MPAPAGCDPLIFIPHGNISYGKLAQALEYGAKTFQVEANFDQILALVRVLAERLGIYLLNSINPFRIEGQKSIVIEMMDQRDWNVPDWIVLPGGNLGNTSAFGKGLREMQEPRLYRPAAASRRDPGRRRVAVLRIHARRRRRRFNRAGSSRDSGHRHQDRRPGVLAQGAFEIETSHGAVEKVTEQEIADAKGIIGAMRHRLRTRLGRHAGRHPQADSAAIDDARRGRGLTGNVLKDPDYIYRYHTGQLKAPDDSPIKPNFGNAPIVVPNDAEKITALLK